MAIACTTDKMFERLSEAMERPELGTCSMASSASGWRRATRSTRSSSSGWGAQPRRGMARCIDKEVPVGKLNSIADIFEDEHFRARGNLASIEAEGVGEVVVPGVVPTPGDAGADRQPRPGARQRHLRGDARAAGTFGGRNRRAPQAQDRLTPSRTGKVPE